MGRRHGGYIQQMVHKGKSVRRMWRPTRRTPIQIWPVAKESHNSVQMLVNMWGRGQCHQGVGIGFSHRYK